MNFIDFFREDPPFRLSALCLASFCLIWIGYYFIKKFKSSKTSQETGFLTLDVIEDPEHIQSILDSALSYRVPFKIKLNNRGQSFNSLLLHAGNDFLIIDELFPYEGNEIISETKFLSLEFTIKKNARIPFRCTASFLQKENFSGYPAIKITFPDSLKRDQKRGFHRVEPSVNEPVYITFKIDGKTVEEKVSNISGGGVGFFTNLEKNKLRPSREIENAVITLPDSVEIKCLSVVHSVHHAEYPVLINNKPYHYYCGTEFGHLDSKTRDKIVRYVIEKERSELQRLNRTI